MEPSNLHPEHRDAQRVVSSKLQRYQDIQPLGDVRDSVQPEVVERMDAHAEHMHSEPTHMPSGGAKPNTVVSGRVHGRHHPVNDEYMPRSVWVSGVVRRLADYIRQLREVDDESNQRPVASQPGKSAQSEQSRHVCTRNPHRTCNCPSWACADDDATYRYARGPFVATDPGQRVPTPKPNHLGNFRCPISGLACSEVVCREWCEGSGPGPEANADRGNAETTDNR